MGLYARNTRDTNQLLPKHRHTLEVESAIDPSVTRERGTYSARTGKEVPQDRGELPQKPGLVIPMYSPDGITRSYQLRPDRKGKGPKYWSPAGHPVIVDAHPWMLDEIRYGDGPILITEGAKTGDAATSRGIPTLVLAGVDMWSVPGVKPKQLRPCFDHVNLAGRLVYACFDSDCMTKEEVQRALSEMVTALEERGAVVKVIYLPDAPDGSKQGIDDYLAAGGTIKEMFMLAREYEPTDIGKIRLSKDDKLRVAVEDLWRRWWDFDWVRFYGAAPRPHIMRGHSCKGLVKALIERIARHGRVVGDEVHVDASQYTLAEDAATRQATVSGSVKHLEAEEWLEFRPSKDKEKPGTYVFRASPYQVGRKATTEGHEVSTENLYLGDTDLRAPALRWSAPIFYRDGDQVVRGYIHRLGKISEGIIHRLEREGEMHIKEVAEALRRRARDLTRNTEIRKGNLVQLEEAGIVEVSGDTVRLTEDWEAALQRERELKGEIDAAERQRSEHKRKREAFRNRDQVTPDQHWANTGADGCVEDLCPADEPDHDPDVGNPEISPADNPTVLFVLDYVARLGKIRLGLLEECWYYEHGGDLATLREAVKLSGARQVRQPEHRNATFLYPPLGDRGAA